MWAMAITTVQLNMKNVLVFIVDLSKLFSLFMCYLSHS